MLYLGPEHMSPTADLIQGPLPSATAGATLEVDVWSSFYIQGKGPFPYPVPKSKTHLRPVRAISLPTSPTPRDLNFTNPF